MPDPLSKIKTLFSNRRFLVFILIASLGVQLIYSFSFPVFGFNDNWQKLGTYIPKFENKSSDNLLFNVFMPLISTEYRLVSDTGNYIELAQNFNQEYFNGHVFVNRPLYSFSIFLLSLPIRLFTTVSYAITFGLSIFLNFILAAAAVLSLFWLLEKLLSLKVAFLSSFLLIFSPYMHVSLIQPLPDMLMAFSVVLSGFFIWDYARKPSTPKLILYSFIVGIFMLAKMLYAIPLFILLLAVYFKKYREAAVFLAIQLIPMAFWYLWVTQVWKIPYSMDEIKHWGMGAWLLSIPKLPWSEILRILLSVLPSFIKSVVYGFLLIPIFFSVIGYRELPFKSRGVIYFGSFLSIFALFFAMNNIYSYHKAFLLFPVVYPTCILGMEKFALLLKKYKSWFYHVFYAVSLALILLVSNINIGRVFDWFDWFRA